MHLSTLSGVRVAMLAALGLAALPLAHCSNDSLESTPSTGTIGPSGGALASSDYAFEILVPAGALSSDVTFTITSATAPTAASGGATVYAPAYTISNGSATPQSFAIPAVLSFSEEAISASAINDPTDYRVAAFGTSDWVPLANPSLDLLAYTVEGTATVLSANPYSVVVPTGGTCVSIAAGCAGDDAGCTPSCAPVIPGKCAAYAGAVVSACSENDAATGIEVSCCYPSDAPLCFTQSEPDGCESPCSQLPGSMAQSCVPDVGPPLESAPNGYAQSTCCFPTGAPVCMVSHATGSPAPTCAGSSPCAAFPGTTVSWCADVSDGTDATCCLPLGSLPATLPSGLAAGDAGVAVDTPPDAGPPVDSGSGTDAGPATDSGSGADAGGGADASDAGFDAGTDSGDDAGD